MGDYWVKLIQWLENLILVGQFIQSTFLILAASKFIFRVERITFLVEDYRKVCNTGQFSNAN